MCQGIVLYYLLRMEPFTKHALQLQGACLLSTSACVLNAAGCFWLQVASLITAIACSTTSDTAGAPRAQKVRNTNFALVCLRFVIPWRLHQALMPLFLSLFTVFGNNTLFLLLLD